MKKIPANAYFNPTLCDYFKAMQRDDPKYLYLPVETAARELDAKLLLALYAANKGFDVVLANRAILNAEIHKFPAGIYMSHNFDKGRCRILKILKRLGHQLMAWDEEGLVWLNEQAYQNRRFFEPSVAQLDTIFAWGQEHASVLSRLSKAGAATGPTIIAAGNPRADLLTPQLRQLYGQQAKVLEQKHGDFILLNSNFGWLNYALDRTSKTETLDGRLQRLAQKSRHSLDYIKYRHMVFQAFCDLLPILSERFKDRQIIIRPHPSETPQAWQHATKGLENVSVHYDSDLVPWLMAAGIVLHNGCTTAVEAAMLGKCAIMYEPARNAEFDSRQPRAVSAIAKTADEVVALISSPPSLSKQQEQAMGNMVAGWGESLSAPLIADYLAKTYHLKNRQLDRLSGKFQARVRKLQKIFDQSKANSPSNLNYIGQKFPPLPVAELAGRMRKMADLAGLSCPDIIAHSDRIYKISMPS